MYAMSYLTTLFIIVTLNRIQTLVKSTLGPGIGKPEFLPSIFETLRSGSCSTRKTSLKWQRDLSHHTHVVPLLKLTDKNLPSASTKLLTEHRGHLNLVKRLLANKYVRWCTYFTGLEGESKRREKKRPPAEQQPFGRVTWPSPLLGLAKVVYWGWSEIDSRARQRMCSRYADF